MITAYLGYPIWSQTSRSVSYEAWDSLDEELEGASRWMRIAAAVETTSGWRRSVYEFLWASPEEARRELITRFSNAIQDHPGDSAVLRGARAFEAVLKIEAGIADELEGKWPE